MLSAVSHSLQEAHRGCKQCLSYRGAQQTRGGVRTEPHRALTLQMAPTLLAGKGLCVASMST